MTFMQCIMLIDISLSTELTLTKEATLEWLHAMVNLAKLNMDTAVMEISDRISSVYDVHWPFDSIGVLASTRHKTRQVNKEWQGKVQPSRKVSIKLFSVQRQRRRTLSVWNDTFVLQQESIRQLQDKHYVYVAQQENIKHLRNVVNITKALSDFIVLKLDIKKIVTWQKSIKMLCDKKAFSYCRVARFV